MGRDHTEQETLVLVFTTEANSQAAIGLAEALLEKGLVACVSWMPVSSLYRWQGNVTRSEEVQLLLKTDQARLESLYQTVMSLHSYDTPEWITVSGKTRGPYARWCSEQLEDKTFMGGGERQGPSRSLKDGGQAG